MSPDDSDQLTRSLLRPDCRALQSVIESMLLKILVSSAKQATLDVLTVFGRSLTNSRNKIGRTFRISGCVSKTVSNLW